VHHSLLGLEIVMPMLILAGLGKGKQLIEKTGWHTTILHDDRRSKKENISWKLIGKV
jgi:hypothetical protein